MEDRWNDSVHEVAKGFAYIIGDEETNRELC
jgi:hypothetical protein